MHTLFRIKEYIQYRLKARGIANMHSPFVYDFMENVLHDTRHFYAYDEIESLRNRLLTSHELVTVNDYGAGATTRTPVKRIVRDVLKKTAKPAKQAQLLFRMAVHYHCHRLLEIGTSLGFSAMYLAASGKNAKVITLEGAPELAERARKNFEATGIRNIEVIEGCFETTLTGALQKSGMPDLIFFDGNHRLEPTLQYFNQALAFAQDDAIFIFDDIHWSADMKAAWEIIKKNSRVTLTIDLFYFGIVFFRKQLSKQDFILKA